MLSRGVASIGRRATASQPARGMATAQQLRERISSVKNIQKITSAMKMVAVCKLRVAQENLEKARNFQHSINSVPFEPAADFVPTSQTWVGISSDRGLCGAINSSISRGVRDSVLKAQGETITPEGTSLVLIGEKCKQGLERQFAENFRVTLSETSKFKACTFMQTGILTDYWLSQPSEKSSVFFQKFVSMISYVTTEDTFWAYDTIKENLTTSLSEYEVEGDTDTMQNLYEFRCAVKLYHYFAENETSTLSARMTAMDNSSTNAKDMIDTLQLVLNRNRQAKITTELSEIIAGAAAADEQ